MMVRCGGDIGDECDSNSGVVVTKNSVHGMGACGPELMCYDRNISPSLLGGLLLFRNL